MADSIDPSRPSPWMEEETSDRDVVLSSRVRFARNLENVPFNTKASAEEKERIREDVHDVLGQEGAEHSWNHLYVDKANKRRGRLLEERRLASSELLNDPYGALFYTPDESLAVMVNEEDHVRLQSFAAGNQIDATFDEAKQLERELDAHLPFAFDEKLGFLTSCPTNVGTGLRASVLLHMPALVMTQKIDRVLKAVSNLGLTVRGFAGEGSESRGFYFQLSNQVTLGQSAEEMRDNLKRVTNQIVDQERQARQSIKQSSRVEQIDQIWRSYGILRYARSIDTNEALETMSYTRLGIDLDLIDHPSIETIDGLMLLIQPAHLMENAEDELTSDERDFARARRLRHILSRSEPSRADSDEEAGSSDSSSRQRET